MALSISVLRTTPDQDTGRIGREDLSERAMYLGPWGKLYTWVILKRFGDIPSIALSNLRLTVALPLHFAHRPSS